MTDPMETTVGERHRLLKYVQARVVSGDWIDSDRVYGETTQKLLRDFDRLSSRTSGEEMRERAAKVVDGIGWDKHVTLNDVAAAIRALPLSPPGTEPATCKWGGGNDYAVCITCGIEYDWRKEPRPPCPRGTDPTGMSIGDGRAALKRASGRRYPTIAKTGGDPHPKGATEIRSAEGPDKPPPVPADMSGRAKLDNALRVVATCRHPGAEVPVSIARILVAEIDRLTASTAREKAIEALRLAPEPNREDTVYYHWFRDDRTPALATIEAELVAGESVVATASRLRSPIAQTDARDAAAAIASLAEYERDGGSTIEEIKADDPECRGRH